MKRFDKLKNYLLTQKYVRRDAVLAAAVMLCAALLYLVWRQGTFSIQSVYPVSQGYQVRMCGDWVYVLDSGHSCLTKSTLDGRIVYRLSPGLYIDGFTVGADGSVVLNGSSFGGMTVIGEQILYYDSAGKGPRVIADNNYGDKYLSKHSLHASSEWNGLVRYVECLPEQIVSWQVSLSDLSREKRTYAYPNAFNAVSDACFYDDKLFVLDRNGTIFRLEPEGGVVKLYNAAEAGEGDRVPYRMSVSDTGEVYFTDIRSRTVQHVLEGRSETVVENTDSVTVDVDDSGGTERCALVAEDTVQLPDGRVLTSFRNTAGMVLLLYCARVLAVIGILSVLLLLARMMNVFLHRKRTPTQRMMLTILVMGFFTAALTGTVLINSFRGAFTDNVNESLLITAISTANLIRPDDVNSINRPEDYGSDAYRRVSEAMEDVFDRDVDFNRNAYCNILRWDRNGPAYCIAYLDGSIGTYYPLSSFESEETIQVYETLKPVISDAFIDISGIYLGVKVPIVDDNGACVGVVSAGTQLAILQTLLRSMVIRVLTSVLVFVIMIWFAISEVTIYVKNVSLYRTALDFREQPLPGHTFRILLVLIFAAYNLEATFLPSYIIHQLPEIGNRELLASLPYTVNIFLVGLTALFCAGLVRRVGLRVIVFLSTVMAGAGNLLIFLVPGYFSILAGMALIGVGVGLVTNVMYVVLTYFKVKSDQVWGLSIYNAAVMAGVNIGMVGGGILAVLLGQREVFAVCAALWGVLTILSVSMMRQMSAAISLPTDGEKMPSEPLRVLLRNRMVPLFMLCIQNPYIVFSSFVMYYLPIFCDAQGYSEISVSLLLLCYAELSILMGDTIVEHSQRMLGSRAMYAAQALSVAALLVFGLTRDLFGMLAALLLLGLSASFGKPMQQSYFMELPQVQRYGADRAMGIYNFSENIGESLGPVIMAWMMSRIPMFPAVAGFCGIVVSFAAVHAVATRPEK